MESLPYANYEIKQGLRPKSLTGFSGKLLDQHWSLYEGYVANVNALNKTLWERLQGKMPFQEPSYAEMERRLGFEYNGMILHEYYFGALTPGVAEPAKTSELAQRFARDFGSFENWKRQFAEIGKMRGIGWVVTSMDPSNRRLANFWISDHEVGHVAGFIPVVVMDMWEHAYVVDYGAVAAGRAGYIEAYFKNLDWKTVEDRLTLADHGKLRPREAAASLV